MNIFTGLETIVDANVPLAKYTWYGLGGNAEYFIKPKNIDQLSTIAKRCSENEIPMYVLGYGSNLLVRDQGLYGAVIKLEADQFQEKKFDGETLTIGAGANLGKIVLDCVKKELSGLEALTGIPGTIGGAVRMNAGGNFGDIGSIVESVTLMDSNGNVYEKSKPELIFDYRQANITAKFILAAKIALSKADSESILRTIKEIWMYKKNSQPLSTKNAGCIFKNPRGISAGAVIERAGLKGLSVGGAQVSEKHANFILANTGCKSSDIENLIGVIKGRVREQSDIDLELELEIW